MNRCASSVCLLFFLLMRMFVMPPPARADDPCAFSVCLSDTTCTVGDCTGSTDGCVSTTFTVPCEVKPRLRIEVKAQPGADCHNCRGCIWVYKNGQPVAQGDCHTTNECDVGECVNICGPSEDFLLEPNVTYTLYVCKMACYPIPLDCDDPDDPCTNKFEAQGCLIYP